MVDDRIVYFDMDGVLVNFRKGASNIGIKFKGYDIVEPEISWKKISDLGIKFWSNLSWIKGSKELFELACTLFPKVEILSARSKDYSSVIGKLIWCEQLEKIAKEHKTKFKVNIVWQSQKKKFSKTKGIKNLLIDDLEDNLLKWEGDSILFKNSEQAKTELMKYWRKICQTKKIK